MALQTIPVTQTGSAVAGANGRAEVALGTVPIGVTWRNVSTQVNTDSVALGRAFVYKGIADTPSNQLDDTGPLGANGNSSASAWVVLPGDHLRVVFEGVTPGSTCTATAIITQAGI